MVEQGVQGSARVGVQLDPQSRCGALSGEAMRDLVDVGSVRHS